MIRRAFFACATAEALLAADLRFFWKENPVEEKISHYVLYYGPNSGEYTKSVETSDVWAVVNKFPVGYYYCCVVAVNESGTRSRPSPEIEFKVSKKQVTITK